MTTFWGFHLSEQFRVSIFSFWRILNRFQRKWAFFQSSVGWKQYWCWLPAERAGVSSSVDMYWLRAETAVDSLSKVEVPSYHPGTLGNELLPLGLLPGEQYLDFLISLGWDENEPHPCSWTSFPFKWSDTERQPRSQSSQNIQNISQQTFNIYIPSICCCIMSKTWTTTDRKWI